MNILRSCSNRNTAAKYISKLHSGLKRSPHRSNKPRNNHHSIPHTVGKEPSLQQAKFPRPCRAADSLLQDTVVFPQALYPMAVRRLERPVVFPSALNLDIGETASPSPTFSGLQAH